LQGSEILHDHRDAEEQQQRIGFEPLRGLPALEQAAEKPVIERQAEQRGERGRREQAQQRRERKQRERPERRIGASCRKRG
jgi:hypothetical protein